MVFNIRIVLVSVLFSLAVAPALAQIDVECNNTGTTGDCSQFITKFCADVANVEAEAYEDVYRCYNAPGFACELTAYNTYNATGNPSEANCRTVLNEVSKRCPKGGEAKFTAESQFIFTIDPDEKEMCASTTVVDKQSPL